jgi:cell division protein FtsL
MVFLLFAVVVVAATLFGLAAAQALVSQATFRLSTLTARAERIRVQNDFLRLEVAELSTLDRIEDAARRAGLVKARRVEVLDGAGR